MTYNSSRTERFLCPDSKEIDNTHFPKLHAVLIGTLMYYSGLENETIKAISGEKENCRLARVLDKETITLFLNGKEEMSNFLYIIGHLSKRVKCLMKHII